jgi:hypothetical protein
MTVDTSLGFAGVIVGLLGLGATYLWPGKRWIGFCAISLGLAFLVWAAFMAAGSRSLSASATVNEVFSGIVVDETNHQPIPNAEILVAQDQSLPEVLRSDSHGVFAVRLHPGAVTLRINVSSTGYVPEVRTTSPSRTGPEEFQLKPNPSAAPAQHRLGKAPTKGVAGTKANPSVPPANAQPNPLPNQTGTCEGNEGPCIGINNGTANFYTLGSPPPPIRNVSPENVTDAIATLRIATKGTKLRIDGVGESADLESFVAQIAELFRLGGWSAFKGSRTMNETVTTFDGRGSTTSHGEGIRCYSSDPNVAFIAKRALEQIGYPCQGDYMPQYPERFPADFFVSIGAPTN